MAILVIAEHSKGALASATLNTIAAAQAIGGDVTLLVAGHQLQDVGLQAARIAHVKTVLVADHAAYAHQLPENIAQLAASLARDFSHILCAASSHGKNVLPRIAALLDTDPVSDIVAVLSADTFKRPIYAGNAIATVQSSAPVKCATVRTTAFAPVDTTSGNADVVTVTTAIESCTSEFVGETMAKSDRPDLNAAAIVVSGGRGMQSAEQFKLLYPLAERLGAAVGASRAAVDAGFAPNDLQVGQTGKIVAPQLYVAVGISGAIQHLAGMKDSKVIVAINKDADAPIFQVADYGMVGDLFDALPQLQAAL
ncbi:electron transfer flavoprotein subunit alpha/FixB family protein [Paraburkholderia terrae]|uniref:Electron transfer flavoprotein subunit alpha n=1 Tax=Paraburkholderia terrae TaxID=311230 RepID=A0A2I8EY07_9BURK|nr:FAD-binding protein [Paraburkholderia terrae]AUT64497.1 electron transfer flavoprotein subunit alpha [Paraburkholderia terrae]BCZ83922.1 electron transfer flavoprotein subunit alpha [Paraburkholderia terrae]